MIKEHFSKINYQFLTINSHNIIHDQVQDSYKTLQQTTQQSWKTKWVQPIYTDFISTV